MPKCSQPGGSDVLSRSFILIYNSELANPMATSTNFVFGMQESYNEMGGMIATFLDTVICKLKAAWK